MTKEEIYDCMIYHFDPPDPDIPCELDEGRSCEALYRRVRDAWLRLSVRTGIDLDDPDVVEVRECIEKITEICALKMYDYGVQYGKK